MSILVYKQKGKTPHRHNGDLFNITPTKEGFTKHDFAAEYYQILVSAALEIFLSESVKTISSAYTVCIYYRGLLKNPRYTVMLKIVHARMLSRF